METVIPGFRIEGDQKMLRETAARKGFKAPEEHLLQLLRQAPNFCGFMYREYAKRCESEKKNDRNGQKKCDFFRNLLVSDCNAFRGGERSLLFPDDSHFTMKKGLDKEEVIKIKATLRGLTTEEYLDHEEIQRINCCKLMSKSLGKCISSLGYKPCIGKRRAVKRLCEEAAGR